MRNRLLYILSMLIGLYGAAKADNLGYSKEHPLIIGLDIDYAPLQYVDKEGMPQGYDVEFTKELMRRLNVPFTYAPNAWANISGDVLEGRVDLGMMVYSPYRKDITNYSRAVFRLYYQILYRKNQEDGKRFNIRNLEGKQIAFMASRPITDTLRRAGAIPIIVTDLPKATIELSEGKYDAVICFRHMSKFLIEEHSLTNIQAENMSLPPREYCYVSHSPELIEAINSQLEAMEDDGTILRIYGNDMTSEYDGMEIPDWVWYTLAILILLLLLGFIVMQYRHQKLLRKEMRRAQLSEQMKTVFLSNVSHALRTPLNAIIGFSDVLNSTTEDDMAIEDRNQLLGLINQNGQQLLYFINELLQLSDIESNEMQFNRIETDIKQQIEDYRQELTPRLAEGVKLIIKTPKRNFRAVVDPNLMRLVTMHFLDNAAKHTRQGSITVSYEAVDRGMKVSVKDTGDGLPEALRGNIFGLLSEKNTYVQSETPGLGLSICKAVIDRCKGKIGTESPEEGGSQFWYWVPCEII